MISVPGVGLGFAVDGLCLVSDKSSPFSSPRAAGERKLHLSEHEPALKDENYL